MYRNDPKRLQAGDFVTITPEYLAWYLVTYMQSDVEAGDVARVTGTRQDWFGNRKLRFRVQYEGYGVFGEMPYELACSLLEKRRVKSFPVEQVGESYG